MADRFWVGGTGTWDASSTANWSATSGGAAGASAPTSADNVFFDAGSDAGGIFTVTIGTGAVCNNITAGSLDFTGTLNIATSLNIYGNLVFPTTNWATSGPGNQIISFLGASPTVTTNGVIFNASVLFNSGGSLLDDFRTINVFQVQGTGTFNTNNFNITCGGGGFALFSSAIFNAGSSTITSGGSGLYGINITSGTTFNAGTSNIVCTGASPIFYGAGKTFYNVSFTSTSAGTHTITGENTFNNLTFTSLAATGIRNISVGANQTVNGTLTLGTANTAIRRMFMRSDIIGTPRTITAAAIATLADVDFRDIVAAGASGTWSGTRLGNCLGNSNITFDASKSVYRIGTGNWSATQWALSSGGAVDVNNFPLAQDNCIFDTNTATGTHTVDSHWHVNNIDFSLVSTPITWSVGSGLFTSYGSLTLNSNVTVTGIGGINLAGRGGIQSIFSSGVTIEASIGVLSPSTTVKFLDTITTNQWFSYEAGVLDMNGFDLTCGLFNSRTGFYRHIIFGTNKIRTTYNNTAPIQVDNMFNFSYTGTPRFESVYTGSVGTRMFDVGRAGGGTESNAIDVYVTGGSDIIDLRNTGAQVYRTLDFTGFSGSTSANQTVTFYGDLIYSPNMTVSSGSAMFFAKSSGVQSISTNGKVIDFTITKSGNGTLRLNDDFQINSTKTFSLSQGKIDLNNHKLKTSTFSSANANVRSIDFGDSGVLELGGNWNPTLTNFTISGKGTINMTSATAKTFAGGGLTYGTLNQGGAGDLTITGSNTFQDVTNTVAPCTVIFPASTTTYVKDFSLAGKQNELVTVKSSTAGTRATITKV